MSRPLVFLCGMPRSGTTWLGKIFDSHPDTLYLHEPDSVYRIVGVPAVPDVENVEAYRAAIEGYIEALPSRRLTKIASSLPLFPKSYYSGLQFALSKAAVLGAKAVGRIAGEVSVPAVRNLQRIEQLRIVWKSIESTLTMGTIMRVAQSGRGILILRHPCGYIASVLRGESHGRFTSDSTTAEDYGMYELLATTRGARRRSLTVDSFKAMLPIERLAWRWVLVNEKAMDDLRGLANCTHIVYEDLCRDPMQHVRRLFAFAGMEWNEQTEAFIRASTAAEKTAYYSVFKDPLKSANKWRQELAAADVDRVMAVVAQSPVGALYLESKASAA